MNKKMKIVVIGGTGLIGTKLVNNLRERGQEVLTASPKSGVNTFSGEGLAEALKGAQVVVDVANAPSWEDKAVMEFFQTAGRNLLAAEVAAGVRHHVALSIVGAERLPASGYLRAKVAQENLIKASGIPFTIVRSTQFFEFANGLVQSATEGQTVRLSPALMQPIAADDVATALTGFALVEPLNGTVEIAGPEPIRMDELARRFLSATRDSRKVTTDVYALYFGTELNDQSLTPGGLPRFTYALSVCALIVTLGVGSGMAADKNAKITLVEYGPGGTSSAHTHPKSAFIYATVLEGAVRSSVNDGLVVTYRAGESFSEMPGDRHSVSENASQTAPAKLLAVFVVDTDEKELTTPYEK
jgi:uncharacterized protein YbjT (DUF2867 family)/quercetin dioxygenase-like cupin family protein